MNIPESWLRKMCNPPLSGRELADRLTMAGLEVESYEPFGPQFSGVVVGEIVAVERHPSADKLAVCTVSTGKDRLRVVCGAPNARAGMKAPLAMVGARLPALEITKVAVRGVESDGMQRRVPDYTDAFADWNQLVFYGFLLVIAGMAVFFINVFLSLFAGRKAPDNYWGEGATTLEWTLSSPPPFHQFETLPVIDDKPHH